MSKVHMLTPEDCDTFVELDKQIKAIDKDSRIMNYYYLEDKLKVLSGKILTIVDASISDKQQNKCVKDLMKTEFYRRIDELQRLYWDDRQGHTVKLESDIN